MTKRPTGLVRSEYLVDLRRRAEKKFSARESVDPETTSPEAIKELLHELQVHQIELEMQNEELRRTQAELDASQASYFELYDLAPIGYLTLTEKKLISNVNLTAASMFGIVRSALCKEPISRILPKEEQVVFCQQLKQCLAADSPQNWDMRLVRADGSMFWAHLQAIATKDGEYWITLSDITERKQAEVVLQASENEFRSLAESMPQIVWITRPDGWNIYFNQQWVNYTGLTLEESYGHGWNIPFHPDDRQRAWDAWQGATHNNVAYSLECRLRRADGDYRWWLIRGVPIYNSDGEIFKWFGTCTDIEYIKQAEEDNAKLTAQLQQARKIEAIGRLAGGVAHDFNNMLVVIIGYTEMAMRKLDPSQPLYADLEEVKKAAERSAALTRQLLAFARKQTIEPTVLDLNVVIASMLNMLQRLIGENIKLKWQPGAAPWQVLADPSQIDQMLANLCVNIRDAITDVGKATIETGNCMLDDAWCASHLGSVPGEYVRISIKDNGSGMEKEVLEHLFEPFFTTKEIGKGTGMGLATVYGIVKQNNGFLTVDSQPGEGATFTIYLPRHLGKSWQIQEKPVTTPPKRNKETILVVEDEATVLEMAKVMLTMQGYSVLAANSPAEAVRLAREHEGEIDLLLTDVIMPEMNGRDLAGKLLSLYPGIKSLFMSGYTADVISHHGVLAEGIFFIQKPFSLEGLTAKVRGVLDL